MMDLDTVKEKFFMMLVKDSKTDLIQGDYLMEFSNKRERAASTLYMCNHAKTSLK